MRQIQEAGLLEQYLKQYHIPSFFDTTDLPFRLYEYEPGEMINVLHPLKSMTDNGTLIHTGKGCYTLKDAEEG